MREKGLWKQKIDAGKEDAFPECDLRPEFLWIGQAFFDLSNKRKFIGGFSAVPQPIDTSKIREHFFIELGLKGAGFYKSFRMLIDKMDGDWREDWRERDEARRRQEEEEARIKSKSGRR